MPKEISLHLPAYYKSCIVHARLYTSHLCMFLFDGKRLRHRIGNRRTKATMSTSRRRDCQHRAAARTIPAKLTGFIFRSTFHAWRGHPILSNDTLYTGKYKTSCYYVKEVWTALCMKSLWSFEDGEHLKKLFLRLIHNFICKQRDWITQSGCKTKISCVKVVALKFYCWF